MSKSANYPRKPFKTAIEIAEHVDKLGGKCSFELLSQSLGVKITGAYHDSVNTAIKHGLISKFKETLELTPLYTDIKLSYSDEEKQQYLKKSFLKASVYGDMLKRFDGKAIPTHILDKMLMKEFNVSESIAKSVGSNLIKGAKSVGLIVNDKVALDGVAIEKEPNGNDQSDDEAKDTKEVHQKRGYLKQEENTKEETSDKKVGSQINIDGLGKSVNLNINISLTVPETTNEEVYNKFFEAMKNHLLS